MKIIHTADLHLDASLSSYLDAEKAASRKKELLHNFIRLSQYAKEQGVDAILIAGDLFDKRTVTKTVKKTILDTIKMHPDISYFYLQGNHDHSVFSEELNEVENLFVFGETWTTYALTENVTITGVEFSDQNRDALYGSLSLPMGKVNILMMHGQEQMSDSKEKKEVISIPALKNHQISYLALGHIHKYKRAMLDAHSVYCYPGTLEAHGFDESGPHGFVLLDIDEEKKTVNDTFIPFALREMADVFVDVTDSMSTMECLELLRMSIKEATLQEKDMLRIVLTGEKNADADIDPMLLEKMLSDYYMVRVYDETSIYVDYKKYLLDQSLKGEFVRMVMDDPDISDSEKAVVIQYGLHALSGEEIQL